MVGRNYDIDTRCLVEYKAWFPYRCIYRYGICRTKKINRTDTTLW